MKTVTPTSVVVAGKWKLEGYDTFEASYYPLEGEYDSRAAAENEARARLDELEESQPSKTSGGPSGIQDRVYIIDPDGKKSRFFG